MELAKSSAFEGDTSDADQSLAVWGLSSSATFVGKLTLAEPARLQIKESQLVARGCSSDAKVGYHLRELGGSLARATYAHDKDEVVSLDQFPGMLAAGTYAIYTHVGTQGECHVSGSIMFDKSAAAASENKPTPIPGNNEGNLPVNPTPTPTPTPTPANATFLSGRCEITAPYKRYEGPGDYRMIGEAFHVDAAQMSFSRISTDLANNQEQEEDYDATFRVDATASPKRFSQTVSMLRHSGLTGVDVGSNLYCIFKPGSQARQWDIHCSQFSYPTDFFSNTATYQCQGA